MQESNGAFSAFLNRAALYGKIDAMRPYILIPALLVLAGCATGEGYSKMMNSWIGDTESNLVSKWGAPSGVYETKDGSKVLTYIWTGNTRATATEALGTVYMNSRTQQCKTSVTIDPQGKITRYSWEGHCRAYE